MNFGLLLHTRQLIRAEDAASAFSHLWDDAAQAEALGFDHVWLGDSVTVLDKARGDCLTTTAALAARTKKIRLGIVPILPALRNPVLLAHSLATIDAIANGRLILGVSVGPVRDYIQRQFAACGVPPQEKAGRLSETIEIMRKLWSEPKISYQGRYFNLDNVGILPHPVNPNGIPIWIAADRNETGFKRVARLGDGWVTLAPTLERFTGARAKIDDYAKDYGRAGKLGATALYATFHLAHDRAQAQEAGWRWMENFFAEPRAKLGHHFTIFTTPEDCAALLRGYAAAGLTDIVARIAADDARGQAELLLGPVKAKLES